MQNTQEQLKIKARQFAAEAFTVRGLGYQTRPIVEALLDWAFDGDESLTLEQCIEWNLETCSCSGCHAPSGLIYNHDIASKFQDWWDDIDDALEGYREATGDSYIVETCGSLVWFAVEWYAHEVASLLRSEFDI